MGVLAMSADEAVVERPSVVNDFSIVAATANGTGSQTANSAILRALFKMGIPVNGKNIFPSNIQGLPTWYHIRVSHEGYVARRHTSEVLIAFNPTSVNDDIKSLPSGGICIHNGDWRTLPERDDITYYAIPVNQFVRKTGMKGKLKDYISNMVYVGAVAHLLEIPLEKIEDALDYHFKGRRKLVDSNMAVVKEAYEWTSESIQKTDPYRVEAMNATAGKIMIDGNEAAALGTVYGGVTFAAWYPITPSTSLIDGLNHYLPKLRRDPETGENTFAVVQAEDELAAIGMILGAGWAGARSVTATSGPGISLMAEFAGLGYFAEIPAVIWDVQRVGPSTGLPTRTGQGDVISTYYLGHGDTKNVILLPATVAECFEFGTTSLNLAEELQTPIFVLSDLDLGMNNWMSEPFAYPTEPIKRGKVLSADDVQEKGFTRFLDIDGDGVGYRTLPGNEHPLSAWFARGTGHNEKAVYSEKSEDWLNNMARLERKFDTARQIVPAPIIDQVADAKIGIIAFGSTLFAIDEARDRMAADGTPTSFMRLRALPINGAVKQFVAEHGRVYVIEMNRDGQIYNILQTEMPELATKLISLAHLDGMPLTARWVVDAILRKA
ncbi:2-oxoglutarate/2-oxoacid ferredoxin oxidoreductase, gamma subunit / 2-oxoglutarate/2-oxoacid ferredoxin oxidoreductase, alpha subunit [hydrothermal vent metagenome]|uniref:2-oxoglutarate/2-oxoacid ferredoxin oxidoreductase, gamma subunit / 2-oxoglutarate/2-oxoacid ferredoxin oxidoreductase, alpha subunit n=1 Tax=hydrothermal vent metagenome TaxID=652676 RepID=A0A3B0UNW2_9ZZZZ